LTQNITAFTLIDITNTGETRIKQSNSNQYYQQQNFNTLIQSIGLRSQPLEPIVTYLIAQDIVEYGFGKQYQGLHTVWRMDFSIEHSKVFNFDGKEFYYLENDIDGIAIITGLEETAELNTRCFETTDSASVNILFKKNQDVL
jgi:hypothetical protein